MLRLALTTATAPPFHHLFIFYAFGPIFAISSPFILALIQASVQTPCIHHPNNLPNSQLLQIFFASILLVWDVP